MTHNYYVERDCSEGNFINGPGQAYLMILKLKMLVFSDWVTKSYSIHHNKVFEDFARRRASKKLSKTP